MQLLLASARAATPEILTLRARYFIEKGRIIENDESQLDSTIGGDYTCRFWNHRKRVFRSALNDKNSGRCAWFSKRGRCLIERSLSGGLLLRTYAGQMLLASFFSAIAFNTHHI